MKYDLHFISYSIRKTSEMDKVHKHVSHELIYYTKGSGNIMIEDKSYEFSQDTIAIIPSGVYHNEKIYESTDIVFIGFKCDSLDIENRIYHDNQHHDVLNLLKQVKEEVTEQKKSYKEKINLLLELIFIEIERLQNTSNDNLKDFSYITGIIHENYNKHIDLKILAELSGYSYHHFRHLFKQKLGCSPVQYLIDQRINNAKILLVQSKNTISEIADKCGFSNEAQFSSMFKKFTGQTPSVFRKTKQYS
jgi:AraC-like DNA-binding protein/mannose-6-phosphate isomerase-like protein (cupin superfamily)